MHNQQPENGNFKVEDTSADNDYFHGSDIKIKEVCLCQVLLSMFYLLSRTNLKLKFILLMHCSFYKLIPPYQEQPDPVADELNNADQPEQIDLTAYTSLIKTNINPPDLSITLADLRVMLVEQGLLPPELNSCRYLLQTTQEVFLCVIYCFICFLFIFLIKVNFA